MHSPDADADRDPTPTAARRAPERPDPLHGVVVRYDARPDRCTVHPRGLAADERTTLWLSADCSAFRPLEEMR
jgi:hypothetical protein